LSDFNEALVFSKDINDGQMAGHETTGRFWHVCESSNIVTIAHPPPTL